MPQTEIRVYERLMDEFRSRNGWTTSKRLILTFTQNALRGFFS